MKVHLAVLSMINKWYLLPFKKIIYIYINMEHIEKNELIRFLIEEMDHLEPKYQHYEYYYLDLITNRPSNLYENYREGFINEISYLDVNEVIEYMVKHHFIYNN